MHELGCCYPLLRPDNIYISLDGTKIKLGNVRGISKIDDMSRVTKFSDIEINVTSVYM